MRRPSYAELLAVVSRVRTCPDGCGSCRAAAAEALGEPVDRCAACGFPVLPGERCGCERHAGGPANPASERFKALA